MYFPLAGLYAKHANYKPTETQQLWHINMTRVHKNAFSSRLSPKSCRFSPGLKTPLLKCLRIFCHVETFSVSHYSFIAHLSGAPCNSPQSSQITKPDKKHFVSSSPNLCLLAPEHCVRTRSGWHAVIHADAGTFYSHLQYVNQYMHVYILLLGIIRH